MSAVWSGRLKQIALDLDVGALEVEARSFDWDLMVPGAEGGQHSINRRIVFLVLNVLDPPPRAFRPLLLLPEEFR